MSYQLVKTVSFGSGKAGFATVGFTLLNSDGTVNMPRSVAGVIELGGGQYAAGITFPDSFQGFIKWDTGESAPAYASEEINPQTDENADVKSSTLSTYGGGDTPGTTLLLSRLPSVLTLTAGKVDVNDKSDFELAASERVKLAAVQPDFVPSKSGDAMTLTAGERTAVANEVEALANVSSAGDFTDNDRSTLTAVKSKTDLLLPTTVLVSANVTIEGSKVTARRGTTISISFNGLGSLVGRTALYFTAKWSSGDVDSASIFQIKESVGLLVLNGSPATGRAGEGSITVIDAAVGNLVVTLNATAADELLIGTNCYYDIKVITGSSVDDRVTGALDVVPDITRALA